MLYLVETRVKQANLSYVAEPKRPQQDKEEHSPLPAIDHEWHQLVTNEAASTWGAWN